MIVNIKDLNVTMIIHLTKIKSKLEARQMSNYFCNKKRRFKLKSLGRFTNHSEFKELFSKNKLG